MNITSQFNRFNILEQVGDIVDRAGNSILEIANFCFNPIYSPEMFNIVRGCLTNPIRCREIVLPLRERNFTQNFDTLDHPAARLLLIFLLAMDNEMDTEIYTFKLDRLYEQAILEARQVGSYKLENFIITEYCQHVAMRCRDQNEIVKALLFQQDLLDDYEYGLGKINKSEFAEPYKKQFELYLLLMAKLYKFPVDGNSTNSFIKLLGSAISSHFDDLQIDLKFRLQAMYHLACLKMRYDNLDFCNLKEAYYLLNKILSVPDQDPLFIARVKYRLSELIRQNLSDDILAQVEKREFDRMCKLLLEVIYDNRITDSQIKAKSQFSYAIIYYGVKFSSRNTGYACMALKQVLSLSTPSSLLIPLAHQLLGTILTFGTTREQGELIQAKAHLNKAMSSGLLNEASRGKIERLLKLQSLFNKRNSNSSPVTLPSEALKAKVLFCTEFKLLELRKALLFALELVVEGDSRKFVNFYEIFADFCIIHQNFDSEFLSKFREEEDYIFGEDGILLSAKEEGIEKLENEIYQNALKNLYDADLCFTEKPEIANQIYQTTLTLIYSYISIKSMKYECNYINGCPDRIRLYEDCEVINKDDGSCYQTFDQFGTSNKGFYKKLFIQSTDPLRSCFAKKSLESIEILLEDVIQKKEHKFFINDCDKLNLDHDLQQIVPTNEEIISMFGALTWSQLNSIEFNPEYKDEIASLLFIIHTRLYGLCCQTLEIGNDKASQERLVSRINTLKLYLKLRHATAFNEYLCTLNQNYLKLAGLLSGEEKRRLLFEVARYNRDQYLKSVLIEKDKFFSTYYIAMVCYMKILLSTAQARVKIEILKEMLEFGPSTFDDFQVLHLDILNNCNKNTEYISCLNLVLHYRLQLLLFLGSNSLAQELMEEIKKTRVRSILELFTSLNAGTIQLPTEGKGLRFQLPNRESILSTIGPEQPLNIRFQFEIPLQRKKKKHPQINIADREEIGSEAKFRDCMQDTSNFSTVTSEAKKAAALQLQSIERKQKLKKDKGNAHSEKSPKAHMNMKSEVEEPKLQNFTKKIWISKDPMKIFEKLWIPQNCMKKEHLLKCIDAKNYRDDIKLSRKEVAELAIALNGKYSPGKGSHEKFQLQSIDEMEKIIIDGRTMAFSDFGFVEEAVSPSNVQKSKKKNGTVPLPKTDYLGEYLVLQLRNLLIDLGYNPYTVLMKEQSDKKT